MKWHNFDSRSQTQVYSSTDHAHILRPALCRFRDITIFDCRIQDRRIAAAKQIARQHSSMGQNVENVITKNFWLWSPRVGGVLKVTSCRLATVSSTPYHARGRMLGVPQIWVGLIPYRNNALLACGYRAAFSRSRSNGRCAWA